MKLEQIIREKAQSESVHYTNDLVRDVFISAFEQGAISDAAKDYWDPIGFAQYLTENYIRPPGTDKYYHKTIPHTLKLLLEIYEQYRAESKSVR